MPTLAQCSKKSGLHNHVKSSHGRTEGGREGVGGEGGESEKAKRCFSCTGKKETAFGILAK